MAAISRILRLLTRIRLPNYVGTSASIRPLKSLAVELGTLRPHFLFRSRCASVSTTFSTSGWLADRRCTAADTEAITRLEYAAQSVTVFCEFLQLTIGLRSREAVVEAIASATAGET